jgi:hypothetical protein
MSNTNQYFSYDESLKSAVMIDATKSMFEDMVKKVIMDMVSDDDSDTILTTKTISSAKEFESIKKEGRRVSSLSPKRRSSSRSSVTSSRSAFSYKDFSKMSLVGEEDISIADNLEEEETSIARSDADSSSTVKEDRKTNSKEKKMKKKKLT